MDSSSPLPPRKHERTSFLLDALLRSGAYLDYGQIAITLPAGAQRLVGAGNAGPLAMLHIHNNRLARRFLLGGILGFCESYLDEDWSSPDRLALFDIALRNEAGLQKLIDGQPLYRLWQGCLHAFNRNNRRGSRRNIKAHYDLGNDFYALWLDESFTYSSALFGLGAQPDLRVPLSAAQHLKYQHLARMIDLQPGQSVLEIGCGWGGFAEFAAGEMGCTVTALTLSPAQQAYAQQRMHKAGLAEKVEIRRQDYRDTRENFDRIVSIEMLEAVGEAYWPRYCRVLHDRLRPGGIAGLQAITIAERFWPVYRVGADFIQKHVFPGGMLPTENILVNELSAASLQTMPAFRFGQHYAETLQQWQHCFQAAWPQIAELGYDARFKKLWELYLDYCTAGFRAGTIDVIQLAAKRPA